MDTYCKYCPKHNKNLAIGEHGGNAYCQRIDHQEMAWKDFTGALSWNRNPNKHGRREEQANRHQRGER